MTQVDAGLLACPFCGGKVSRIIYNDDPVAWCQLCDFTVSISVWNIRAPPPEAGEREINEQNDECYCDFESRRFFGSDEMAHDPICPQYNKPTASEDSISAPADSVKSAMTEWFDNLDWEGLSDESVRHVEYEKMLAALSSPPPTAGREAHKTMTPYEYAIGPIIGWHEVCRDVDGFGGVGVRFLGETVTPSPSAEPVAWQVTGDDLNHDAGFTRDEGVADIWRKAKLEVRRLYASSPISEASLSFICPKCGTRGITDGNASTASEASREALDLMHNARLSSIHARTDNIKLREALSDIAGFNITPDTGYSVAQAMRRTAEAALAKSFDNTGDEK